MPRRAALLALALLAAAGCQRDHRPGPDHILLIVVDTLRADHVSAYGGSVETPNIDALAERGQRFENVFASFHQTSMSMGAMFTGRTPSIESGDPTAPLPWNSSTWCGMARFTEEVEEGVCIPDSVPTLAERLREAGFWTAGVVSNQFLYAPAGFQRGFDDWVEVDERNRTFGPASREGLADAATSRNWEVVNAAALEAVERMPDGPAFLYVHYVDVHDYVLLRRPYSEMVRVQDAAIGALLRGLEEFLRDGVVVLASDHGERLGEDHGHPGELPHNTGHYGNPSWEEVLRVPLIVAPPRFEDTSRFLRTQDLHGLVLELAGVDPLPWGDTQADELFVGEAQYRTYRQGRWKTLFRRRDGKAFLFDLATDPDELDDLSGEKPLQVYAHRLRVNELTDSLSGEVAVEEGLSADDEARLRALGYLDPPARRRED